MTYISRTQHKLNRGVIDLFGGNMANKKTRNAQRKSDKGKTKPARQEAPKDTNANPDKDKQAL